MSIWEPTLGATDEWYTPRYIFEALEESFDLDVAAPPEGPRHVPATAWFSTDQERWHGFVWCNPPFGGRNALVPWLDKFFDHGYGIALTPDRTSAPWWQDAAAKADAMLCIRGRVKFERPDGSIGKSPGSGVTLWAAGYRAVAALQRSKLGPVFIRKEF